MNHCWHLYLSLQLWLVHLWVFAVILDLFCHLPFWSLKKVNCFHLRPDWLFILRIVFLWVAVCIYEWFPSFSFRNCTDSDLTNQSSVVSLLSSLHEGSNLTSCLKPIWNFACSCWITIDLVTPILNACVHHEFQWPFGNGDLRQVYQFCFP